MKESEKIANGCSEQEGMVKYSNHNVNNNMVISVALVYSYSLLGSDSMV